MRRLSFVQYSRSGLAVVEIKVHTLNTEYRVLPVYSKMTNLAVYDQEGIQWEKLRFCFGAAGQPQNDILGLLALVSVHQVTMHESTTEYG
jgi:hypothetical protein